jgi:hypothetical protein
VIDETRAADVAALVEIGSTPVTFESIGRAGDLLSGVGPRSFYHAGPPIEPSETIGAMRGALRGALLLEGEATTPEEAERMIANNDLTISPCHDNGGVGALAGVVSPTTPIVVASLEGGPQAFGTVVEGLGRALSFGNYDPATLDKVRWLSEEFSETLRDAFALIPKVDIAELQAKGLRRGDEGHNRVVASTEKLIALLAPAFLELGPRSSATLEELESNPHFFLTLSIAAAKATALAIESRGPRGVVTALTGNGVHVGIRVSGTSRWFEDTPVAPENMMVIPGRHESDATPLMGDSGITETAGLGAFTLTASLSLARVLGVAAAEAQSVVDQMRKICLADHPRFQLPADDFRGSAFGISPAAVTATGITPAVNAGYAHRVPGEGRVGANLAHFPMGPFRSAAETMAL